VSFGEPEFQADRLFVGSGGLFEPFQGGIAVPQVVMGLGESRSPECLYDFEITGFRRLLRTRSGVRRNDEKLHFQSFYEFLILRFLKMVCAEISFPPGRIAIS